MDTSSIDIREDDISELAPELLAILLKDHTMSREKGTDWNIFWATSDYEQFGDGFRYNDQILPENITGINGNIVQPRTCKDLKTQIMRSRDKAEVFTPSWICNAQNNLIDNAWFGREGVFNTENNDNTWTVNKEPITFPKGKNWKHYVKDPRLEITCGEAPYIASRYDTTTGKFIPVENRIGLLDRKLRVVNENCHTTGEWLEAAQLAYHNVYGFEWQGDSLLIARETLLYTFIENFQYKFGKSPRKDSLATIAYIISWNFWQMDGLKFVIPGTCHDEKKVITKKMNDLFEGECKLIEETVTVPCEGCQKGIIDKHNGVKCLIRNWRKQTKELQIEPFYRSIINI